MGRDEERVGGRALTESHLDMVLTQASAPCPSSDPTKLTVMGKSRYIPAHDDKEAGRGGMSRKEDFNKPLEDGMLTEK